MVEFLEFLFFLAIGFIVGTFVYAQILLPLIYAFPKSVYWYLNGRLRLMGVVSQLITPFIWIVAIALLGVLFQTSEPSINEFFITNRGFIIGQLLSIVGLLVNFFSKRGRSDMESDFFVSTVKRYGKAELNHKEAKKCDVHNRDLEEFSAPYSYNYISDRLALKDLQRNPDAFPNVEIAVPNSRFEYDGKIFFRFRTCSECLREYYTFILGNLSEFGDTKEKQSLIKSWHELPSLEAFDEEQYSRWEYFVDKAADAARTGALWEEESLLIQLASYNGDNRAFEVILEEIAARPAVDDFAEPKKADSLNVTIESPADPLMSQEKEPSAANISNTIDYDVLSEDLAFLNKHGNEAFRERMLARLEPKEPRQDKNTTVTKTARIARDTHLQNRLESNKMDRKNDLTARPQLKAIWEKIEQSRARISTGTGRSVKHAFVVEASNSEDAVFSEYKKITEIEGLIGVDWTVNEQVTTHSEDSIFDEITISTRRHGIRTYYFDITSVTSY